ncbi:EF-P 5-aminopentanol modification-associated protein YfmH [Streptococcus sp. sy004]|uniref:EF-P 5-aminopentanol modification-associated protein YfmH n=1 Tax=Streptococcus sp. sy004 TaxID=2600149 RepID=UPI0011B5B78C|nr:pitrilysin family protein [Streptococcus sp. sy004]TWT11078.1 insulinase family protein [Streptococcus sp. sy004]
MSALNKLNHPRIAQELYTYTFNNGFMIYLLPKEDFKEVTGVLSLNFGSIDNQLTLSNGQEKSYPVGVAHFLEHKLFELADGKDGALEFVKLGSEVNAFTSFEQTSYYFTARDQIGQNIDLLFQLISSLTITAESVEKEKAIIAQEIDMYQDDTDYLLYSGALQNLYPETNLAEDIAGRKKEIKTLSIKDLQENYAHFYQPQNMSLVLVGDFDVNEVYNDIDKSQKRHFSNMGRSDSCRTPLTKTQVIPKRTVSVPDISKPKLVLGIRSSYNSQSLLKQKLALQLFFAMLFGWMSKSYQDWYEAGKIDDSFDFEIELGSRFAFVLLFLDTEEPIAMARLLKQKLSKTEQMMDLTEKHFNLVKRELYGEFLRSLDDVSHLASQFSSYVADGSNYLTMADLLEQLTLADVVTIGREFLKEAEMTEFTISPQ